MKVLVPAAELETRRDDWAAIRRRGITASEIASIMRVKGCYSDPVAVYLNKVTGDEIPDTDEMALGRYLEPYIAQRFARRHPGIVTERGPLVCADGRRKWQMATPDLIGWSLDTTRPERFRVTPGGPPEVVGQLKTTATWIGYGDEPDGEVPPAYIAQVLWECDVTGAAGGWLTVMNRATGKIRHYWIGLDAAAQNDIAIMREEGQKFRERVRKLDMPEPDWRPSATAALKRVWAHTVPEAITTTNALRRRIYQAKRAHVATGRRLAAAENALRAKMRTATVALDANGDEFASRAVYPHTYLSAPLVRERYPEIAAECTITSPEPVDRLYIKGWDE